MELFESMQLAYKIILDGILWKLQQWLHTSAVIL